MFEGAEHVSTTDKYFVRHDYVKVPVKDKKGNVTGSKEKEKRTYFKKSPKHISANVDYFLNN